MLKNTDAYTLMKAEYIRHGNFKKILEGNIEKLERELSTLDTVPAKITSFVETDINLPGRKSEKLRLHFFVHPETGDIAPFWLQLLRDPQRKRLGNTGMVAALRNVLNELGW